MFFLRSAFWLTLAFVLIRPDFDMGEKASALSAEAMAQGSQFISQQISSIDCSDLTCHGGKALAVAALQGTPQAGQSAQTDSLLASVPLPRPRPDRTI